MAKASRSNKKQPAFDPSELEDLIFSPAVGKGVGSHLVRAHDVPTVVRSATSTVAKTATVDREYLTTIDRSEAGAEPGTLPIAGFAPAGMTPDKGATLTDLPTVVETDLATVDRFKRSAPSPPLRPLSPAPPKPAPPQHKLWITDNGDLVAESRVRKIRLAQDVINSAEENVYDTLWNAKLIQTDERESCRLVQAGYDYLVKRTRLARKTIQRIVAKLLEKDFIAIETRADIYQRTATVYRVFSYKAVLEKNIKKGRLYVAKMGPGFSYAKPLDITPPNPSENGSDVTTIDRSDMTPVVGGDMATVANETTVTVVKIDPPTVVKMSPHLLDSDLLGTTSSTVRIELSRYAPVDDDAVEQLIGKCRELAPDCTEEEILHFIREKGGLIERKKGTVYNPLGFLMTAVPRCFAPEALPVHREDLDRDRKGKALGEVRQEAAMERWRREQEATLSDPNVSEQEKHLIRLCLGLNNG